MMLSPCRPALALAVLTLCAAGPPVAAADVSVSAFGNADGTLRLPEALAVAPDGTVLVGDHFSGRIQPFRDGRPARDLLGPGALRARALDVAPDGTTWTLTGAGRLAPVGADGRPGAEVGEREPPDRASTDVAVLADGSLAVAEGAAEHRENPADGVIRRYDTGGRRLSVWTLARPAGGAASKPSGLASDAAGGVWVSDSANGRVVRFGADATVLRTLGAPGVGLGELAEPTGLTIDCAGALLVADAGNNRVVRFTGESFGGPPRGCAAAPSPSTAAVRLPSPAGLTVKTTSRASRPQRVLGRVTARCARACVVRAGATGSAYAGRTVTPLSLDARVSGSTISISAGPSQLRSMRSALRRPGGRVNVGVTVVATAADGVRDVRATTLTFR